ncbi:MAG TPA: MarR family transcriptional regulator [Gemmatimonadaceae bacterium]|nr:MarR family transcriptional regulator [Gemmatimonadaceae bacterium]
MTRATTSAPAAASMDATERQQVTAAMNAIRSIVRALRVSSRMVEGRMGISGAQLFVMQQLAERPARSLNELADRTATHQSSVSVVVRRLVEHGYVARTTSRVDRRRVELTLTARGHEVLADAPSTVQYQLLRGARALSQQEQRALADLLHAWVRASGIDAGTPPLFGEDGTAAGT